jgi:hypothetical protein
MQNQQHTLYDRYRLRLDQLVATAKHPLVKGFVSQQYPTTTDDMANLIRVLEGLESQIQNNSTTITRQLDLSNMRFGSFAASRKTCVDLMRQILAGGTDDWGSLQRIPRVAIVGIVDAMELEETRGNSSQLRGGGPEIPTLLRMLNDFADHQVDENLKTRIDNLIAKLQPLL